MRRFYWSKNRNERNAMNVCAPSSPQKHITKESDGLHNDSTLLTIQVSIMLQYTKLLASHQPKRCKKNKQNNDNITKQCWTYISLKWLVP